MPPTQDPVEIALETLSRDILFLIHTARSFPDGHPSVARVVGQVGEWRLPDKRPAVKFGISRTELVLDNRFYGAKRSRTSELAALLNSRSLKSLKLRQGLTGKDLWLFARTVADRRIQNGKPLVEELKKNRLEAIEVEALEVAHIHSAISAVKGDGGEGASLDAKARGQQAWLWLQAEQTDPEELAKALATEELWSGSLGDHEKVLKLGYILSGLGKRLDQSLDVMSPESKSRVRERLSSVGKSVSTGELASILANCPDALSLQKEGMSALVGDMEGEKLIDLMAGVVATGKNSGERINELLKHFSASQNPGKALESVRKRLKSSDRHGYAVEVWRNLEELLLNMNFQSIMHDEYRASIGELRRAAFSFVDSGLDFTDDPGAHIDLIYLGLAMSGGGIVQEGWARLFGRIRELSESGRTGAALKLIDATVEVAPYALSSDPDLPRDIVSAAVSNARALTLDERSAVKKFVNRHGGGLFEFLLSALKDVQKISARKVLVEALAALGNETTPPIISRARSGPWFLTRNLLIVLGKRRDPASIPFLASMLDHEDHRVRRESMRSLSSFGPDGVEPLNKFAEDESRERNDRRLAAALAARASK